MKSRLIFASLTAVLVTVSAVVSVAGDQKPGRSYQQAFKGTPAPEVPAKAALIVAKTAPAERKDVTVAVISYTVRMNPASAPAIVGAVAKAAPEMAALAAKTATRLQPKQARAIARAAATAAPEKAVEIVEVIGRDFPSIRRELALSVAEVAPKAQAQLNQLNQISAETAIVSTPPRVEAPAYAAIRGPSVQGPYIPLPPVVTNAPPAGGDVPAGGRAYARP